MLNISTQSLDSLLLAADNANRAGQILQAAELYRRAIAQNPNHLGALEGFGIAAQALGLHQDAVNAYQKILSLQPANTVALNNSGVIFQRLGHTAMAIDCFQRFLQFYPNNAAVYSNLGTAYQDCGLIDDALKSLRRAIELDPNMLPAASAYLIILQYHPDCDEAKIAAESKRWNDTVARRLVPKPIANHPNSRDPNRQIKIGYVSPDFMNHPLGRFMLPILTHHDKQKFHVTCYSLSAAPDNLTAQLRAASHAWHDVPSLNDDALADLIQRDRIDILVDLAMHTNGGRPYLFARKPAPIQISYLAYPGTTGLDTLDYRLTDPYLDPPDSSAPANLPERPLYLQSYWCYHALPESTPITPLPALQNNFITFGCLNNFAKVNDVALETWAKLLATPIPNRGPSRLILFCPEGPTRTRVLAIFAKHNVPADRVSFITRGTVALYFQTYPRIDIALDSFPYCGGTTTCDALYMGVPVITLRGNKPVARAGASILHNINLPNLIAANIDDYLQHAISLASDLPALANLRQSLRPQMQSSRLMNAPAHTKDLEHALTQAWQAWCRSSRAPSTT